VAAVAALDNVAVAVAALDVNGERITDAEAMRAAFAMQSAIQEGGDAVLIPPGRVTDLVNRLAATPASLTRGPSAAAAAVIAASFSAAAAAPHQESPEAAVAALRVNDLANRLAATPATLSDPSTSRRLPAAVNPPNGGLCVCCLEAPAVGLCRLNQVDP
jgi:hypothetical protein